MHPPRRLKCASCAWMARTRRPRRILPTRSATSSGSSEVRNQDNCKTECPACSRVCPEVAIMFPKYRHGPINGEEISSDDVRREAMKIDISALLGGDVYAALRD